MKNLTGFSKGLIVVVILALAIGAWFMWGGDIADSADFEELKEGKLFSTEEPVTTLGEVEGELTVGIVSYPYAGVVWYNNGFQPNKDSKYKEDFDLDVSIIVNDDYASLVGSFLSGDVDVLATTVDMMPTLFQKGAGFDNVRMVMPASLSWDADVILASREIESIMDLRGQKVACAEFFPSESLLIWLLKAAGMTLDDIILVPFASPLDCGDALRAGEVAAAVVWAPGDAELIATIKGVHKLAGSKDMPMLIQDCFLVKKETIIEKKLQLQALITGWYIGNAKINSDIGAQKEARSLLATGLQFEEADVVLEKLHFCTFGDALNMMGMNRAYEGVTSEEVYGNLAKIYAELYPAEFPDAISWRTIRDISILSEIDLPTDGIHAASKAVTYADDLAETAADAPALTTKQVSINFETGKWNLDAKDKNIIDREFMPFAKSIEKPIRIEGNTDNTGGYDLNKTLSLKRANAVKDYLIESGINPKRIIIKGNGPDKPIANNNTTSGRSENRRTDFELVND